MFDTHTHLNDDGLYPEREKYLQNFIDAGGKGLVNVGLDEERNQRNMTIARTVKEKGIECVVKATIGYHPAEVCFGNITSENIDEKISSLKNMYYENREHIVAIGECGIDTHYPDGAQHIELQKELFRKQCEFAKELGLPIVIHSRDDFPSTLEVIRDFTDQKIYFHCYGYGPEEIRILQNTFPNLRIGFCGNVTYPKAQNIRDALAACEMKNIVFETDAPYLAPQGLRGQTNEPANVKLIYEYAAEQLTTPLEELMDVVTSNVKSLYAI